MDEKQSTAPKKRTRRTKDELEADRGKSLAKEVARLSLSNLAACASAMPAEEAAYLAKKLRGESEE